jgi:hypothetical protein
LAEHGHIDAGYDLLNASEIHETLLSSLARATPATVPPLAQLAEALATTARDRADAGVLRAIESVLSGGSYPEVARAARGAAADLTDRARVQWITTIHTLATSDGPFAAIRPIANEIPCRPELLPRGGQSAGQ